MGLMAISGTHYGGDAFQYGMRLALIVFVAAFWDFIPEPLFLWGIGGDEKASESDPIAAFLDAGGTLSRARDAAGSRTARRNGGGRRVHLGR